MAEQKENSLILDRHILLCIDYANNELNNFCGIIFTDIKKFDEHVIGPGTNIFLCGDIIKIYQTCVNIIGRQAYIIKEISHNYAEIPNKTEISIGQVPFNIHNVGVYFKQFFDPNKDYFDHIIKEHQFQVLTESNKQDNALRKGIYLSQVEEQPYDEYHFNLLRCSTNLRGSTENFRDTDNEIINNVNNCVKDFFSEPIELNHVLAQIYENTKCGGLKKNAERKAKISAHSDKTKDMPRNALMAFCTFYRDLHKHDYKNNNPNIFTRLKFKLKGEMDNMVPNFEIILYPNSVFIMSLTTNRLYTHEISPSILPIDKIPERMGYVIRCSKTRAVHRYGDTFIIRDGNNAQMNEPTDEDIKRIKDLYYKENATSDIIDYGDIGFSLNKGDYMKPKL